MLSWCRRPRRLPLCLACPGVLLALLAHAGPARAQAAQAPAVPSRPEALLAQGKALAETHRYAEAERVCAEALKGFEAGGGDAASRLSLYRCQNQLADVQTHLYKFRDAQAHLASNREALRQLAGQPGEAALRFELARTCELQASCVFAIGRSAETVAPLREAIDLLGKVAAEDPARPEYREELVKVLTTYGGTLMLLARYRDSEAAHEEALRVGRKLVADLPTSAKGAEQLALACSSYAGLLRESSRHAQATDLLREAIRVMAKLESEHPDNPEYWYRLPGWYRILALQRGDLHGEAEGVAARREASRIESRLARVPEEARKWYTDQDRILGRLRQLARENSFGPKADLARLAEPWEKGAREHPDAPLFRVQVAIAKALLAPRLRAVGAKEQALRALREGREAYRELAGRFPEVPAYRLALAEACYACGIAELEYGDPAAGDREMQQGQAEFDKLARDLPDDPHTRYRSGAALLRVYEILKRQGNVSGAIPCFRAALAVVQQLARDYPQCPKYRREAAETTFALGEVLLGSQGDRAGAETSFREGVQLWRQVVADFPACLAFRQSLARALAYLCDFLYKNDLPADPRPLYAEMVRLHEGLAHDFPREPEYLVALATDYSRYGRVLDRKEQWAAAAECCTRTVACLESALKLAPRQHDWLERRHNWLERLRQALQDRAYVYQRLGRRADHDADLQRAEDLDEGLQPAVIRLCRIGQRLGERQQFPRAMTEAEDVFAEGALTAAQWHQLAGLYARAAESSADPAQQETYAARAVESLQRAAAEGYRAPTPLAADAQFHILTARPDFQKLAGTAPR
jgi:hypothetical protein